MVFLNPFAKINLHTHAILYALERKERKRKRDNARILYRREYEPVNPILITVPVMQYRMLCLLWEVGSGVVLDCARENTYMCGAVQYMWILLKVSGLETNTSSFAPTFRRITNIMLMQDD
jgi:hypothetical protein